jgi:polysaccharide biosynthesis protein PslH
MRIGSSSDRQANSIADGGPSHSDDPNLRVLYLAHNGAWPSVDGGRRRDAELLPRLWAKADIDYLAVSQAYERDVRGLIERVPGVRTWRVFADESLNRIFPERSSVAASALLADTWPEFDAIHVEGHYMLDLLPHPAWRRVVLVEHNIESELLRQRVKVGERVRGSEIEVVRSREQRAWQDVGELVTLSHDDAALVAARTSRCPEVITNGWDHLANGREEEVPSAPGCGGPQVLFVGNYEYGPNRDAIRWLIDEIFPIIRGRLPDAQLRLVGNKVPRSLIGDQVMAVGWVEELPREYRQADVVIVPLRVGGGVKVKVTEALQQGCLVVATLVGAQGIPSPFREQLKIGASAEDLANLVVDAAKQGSRQPTQVLQEAPTWDSAAERLFDRWQFVGCQEASATKENR